MVLKCGHEFLFCAPHLGHSCEIIFILALKTNLVCSSSSSSNMSGSIVFLTRRSGQLLLTSVRSCPHEKHALSRAADTPNAAYSCLPHAYAGQKYLATLFAKLLCRDFLSTCVPCSTSSRGRQSDEMLQGRLSVEERCGIVTVNLVAGFVWNLPRFVETEHHRDKARAAVREKRARGQLHVSWECWAGGLSPGLSPGGSGQRQSDVLARWRSFVHRWRIHVHRFCASSIRCADVALQSCLSRRDTHCRVANMDIHTLNVSFATGVDRDTLFLYPIKVRLQVQHQRTCETTMVPSSEVATLKSFQQVVAAMLYKAVMKRRPT